MAIPQIPDWRERILLGVGVRPTSENLRFFDAWAQAEGGQAENNPFNTTQRTSGSIGNYNNLGGGIGVQRYNSPQAGIDATIQTLTNGRYGNIIGALRQGDSAMAAAQALANSPWGTGALTMKVLGGSGAGLPTVTGGGKELIGGGVTGGSTAGGMGMADQLRSQMQLPPLGSGTTGAATAGQPANKLDWLVPELAQPSPLAVALKANLTGAIGKVSKWSRDTDAMFASDRDNEPVTKTLSTLQTGSTESMYQTLDLGQDFDGPVHPNANPVVAMAQQFLGTPYLFGGADPRKGFDCSGFVQYLYAQAGVSLGRTTNDQVKQGSRVDKVADLLPGDVVFFSRGGGDMHHEGLYIGGGQFIHAPHTGDVVKISSLNDDYYAAQFAGGRRFMATEGSVMGETAAPSDANSRQMPGGLAEAFYDPLGSWDSGHFGGPIGGHSDHVHISETDPQGMLNAIKLAQSLGLHVGENPYVDTVEPVHVEGSYHYRTFDGLYDGKKLGQGIDVSGPAEKMAQFYKLMTGS